MIRLKEYIIREGGNAVEASPIPAEKAPEIYAAAEKTVHAKYPDMRMTPLGSCGKKKTGQFNGDIDVAVLTKDKDELVRMVADCFPGLARNEKTTGSICSVSWPYEYDGEKRLAQIDFMTVKDIDWAKFYYWSPDFSKDESKYKGALRNAFLAIVTSEIPVKDMKDEYFDDGRTVRKHWKYTYNSEGLYRQLVDFTGKTGKPVKNGKKIKELETFISAHADEVVKFIFGPDVSASDVSTAEKIWKLVHDPAKFRFQEKVPQIEKRFFDELDLSKYPYRNKEDFR
jgi:hypothetical protein